MGTPGCPDGHSADCLAHGMPTLACMQVLEFRPDTTVLETWKTPDVLGLHPRDVYLFASDVGMGQRAMLAARSSAILFRTDVCKAVVYGDRAVLFPSRCAKIVRGRAQGGWQAGSRVMPAHTAGCSSCCCRTTAGAPTCGCA